MNKIPIAAALACMIAAPAVLSGCGGSGSQYARGARITEKGTVRALRNVPSLPPGTVAYIIQGDSGRNYDGNLPSEFYQDGLRVSFTATVQSINDPQGDALGDTINIIKISRL